MMSSTKTFESNSKTPGLRSLLAPVIASLLQSRWVSGSFAVAGSLQVAAALAHVPGMPCPVRSLFRVPCPGCGLSRACADILHMDFSDAMRMHAFAPFFLLAIALFWLSALLPEKLRRPLIKRILQIEQRTALPTLLLVMLILYWVVRLLYLREDLSRLVVG